MSLLADNLFALLLGWTRSLFNGLWNLITNNSSGFVGFLQRFWLPILIILLFAGTFFDLLIWLIRWRPYYVWGSRLRKRANRKRLERTSDYMDSLDHSPLDLPEYRTQDQYDELPNQPVYFDYHQPDPQGPYVQPVQEVQEDEGFYFQSPQMEPETPFVPDLPWQPALQNSPPVYDEISQVEPDFYEAEPAEQETQYNDAVFMPPEATSSLTADTGTLPRYDDEPSQNTSSRRRRTARHQRSNVFQSIKDTLFTAENEQDLMDGFQPPVRPEDAFHKPFYPQNYNYKDQSVSSVPPEDPNQP